MRYAGDVMQCVDALMFMKIHRSLVGMYSHSHKGCPGLSDLPGKKKAGFAEKSQQIVQILSAKLTFPC
jgi:hypothetical protein